MEDVKEPKAKRRLDMSNVPSEEPTAKKTKSTESAETDVKNDEKMVAPPVKWSDSDWFIFRAENNTAFDALEKICRIPFVLVAIIVGYTPSKEIEPIITEGRNPWYVINCFTTPEMGPSTGWGMSDNLLAEQLAYFMHKLIQRSMMPLDFLMSSVRNERSGELYLSLSFQPPDFFGRTRIFICPMCLNFEMSFERTIVYHVEVCIYCESSVILAIGKTRVQGKFIRLPTSSDVINILRRSLPASQAGEITVRCEWDGIEVIE